MVNTIKKDLRLIFDRRWILVLFLLISIFLIKTSDDSSGIYNWIIFSVYATTLGFFNPNDKEDILIRSLPVSSHDVVLGKYGLMLIIFLLCYLVINMTAEILSGLNIIKDTSYLSLDSFKFTLLMTIVINSIGIPIMLYFGKNSGIGLFFNGILYYVFVGVMNSSLRGNMSGKFIDTINSPLISIIILSLTIVSIFISFIAYKNWQM
ncbi:ABC-2 transporter permease [Tissierella sp. Yu-01]|uniref:ABC-2 transporter permease n=1 Tax=Tissierella sp. Yu-01 TaxID=3035694 RepID=UPI00240E06BE|nr:ABC-2 transporter permease [Tissierella sp. Yu-01]WFA08112.1 ABC-2 transporter permease [Tissierella sp. Yu-01]